MNLRHVDTHLGLVDNLNTSINMTPGHVVVIILKVQGTAHTFTVLIR